ncbi:type VI secretion system tube protein Hcp [Luteimonas sp. BDR2-5]|uniref:Hcp family type VI secretion system effector n=1 Tax=Proluteimonas luteida TaxID=2878685 RepID=UPI001E64BDB4|nr:type VI secretion system tube protein Hcp [Luteimonas sp. BDR2-5]MCD9029078.1 type VI secretion system tube protein Hcp [Luteimonas sp. BDR2-5]
MSTTDMFLMIDGIKGESADEKHKDEIDVQSWSWGESNAGSMALGGGGGTGRVQMQDFNFTMLMNKASPMLMDACAQGAHIKKAVLTCRKAGGGQHEYLVITFEDLMISSYQTGGGGGNTLPMESISFNFSKITQDYKPQAAAGTPQGSVSKSYNLKTNKAA